VKGVPIDDNYMDGNLFFDIYHFVEYYYKTNMDPGYQNIVWMEVPNGSAVGPLSTAYYNQPPIYDIGGSGYTRYIRILNPVVNGNPSSDWNRYHYTGQAYNTYDRQVSTYIVPPPMSAGATFNIRVGSNYQYTNGTPQSATFSINFTKINRPVWELYTNPYHSIDFASTASICGLSNGAISQYNVSASHINFANNFTTKGLGTGAITGVSFTLYQKETGAPKVNFNEVILRPSRAETLPPWAVYKVEYEIINASNGVTRMVADPVWRPTSATAVAATRTLTLPTLTATEYINKIIATPMGTDSISTGVLPAMNGIGFRYNVKSWNNRTFPDG
jgi:hypothetical protein